MFDALKNIFKPSDERRALEFWTWFVANEKNCRNMSEDGEAERDHRIKVFLDHLTQYDHHLTFLIGKHDDGIHELIISADGMKAHFPSAEALVAAAPEVAKWRFIALKPPVPDFGPVLLNDKRFELNNLQFARVEDPEDPSALNLVVFHPPYPEEEQELHVIATFMLLDNLLGERSVAEDIQGLDIKPLTAEVPPNVLRPIKALPQVILYNK